MSRRRQRQTANGGRRFNRRSLTVSGGKATTDASRHRLLETSPSTQVNRGYGKVEGGQTTHGEFRFTVELGGGRCRLVAVGACVNRGRNETAGEAGQKCRRLVEEFLEVDCLSAL